MNEDKITDYKETKNRLQDRLKNQRDVCKVHLKKTAATKIRTTMIGALATVERHFSEHWNDNPELKAVYEKVRQEILDNGNNQIRNFEIEIDNYEIIKKKDITIPVRKESDE